MPEETKQRQEDFLRQWIIARMFILPADETYLLARVSALGNLHSTFAWLANHAIEKYLKANILLRGQPLRDRTGRHYGHDTVALYRRCVEIDRGLSFPQLVYPEEFPDELRWIEPLEATLVRLNAEGDPHSRYGVQGYRVFSDDLLKLDRMIFHLRTRCRGKRLSSDMAVAGSIEDAVETRHLETFWSIDRGGVLERALHASDDKPDPLGTFAKSANIAFLKNHAPRPSRMPSAFGVGAFPSGFFPTDEPDADPVLVQAVDEVLRWAKENIYLPKELQRAIEKALSEIAGRPDLPRGESP